MYFYYKPDGRVKMTATSSLNDKGNLAEFEYTPTSQELDKMEQGYTMRVVDNVLIFQESGKTKKKEKKDKLKELKDKMDAGTATLDDVIEIITKYI